MANRRMFSSRIGNSAKFLQMPSESQLLYFHLVIRADDDGIVECYPVMKMLGLAPDNFKVLIAKNFIKQLNEDQVIVVVDWLEHNLIRADRKIDSVYINLLKKKIPEIKIIEPKPRSDVEDNSKRLGGQSTDGISQVKLSKDKIREDKIKTSDETSQGKKKFNLLGEEVLKAFESIDPKNKTYYGNKTQRASCDFLLEEYGMEKILKAIKILPQINQRKLYIKQITTPFELKENWVKLGNALKQDKDDIKNKPNYIL